MRTTRERLLLADPAPVPYRCKNALVRQPDFRQPRRCCCKGTTPEAILSAVSQEHCTIVWLLVPWAQDLLDALDRGDIQSGADYEYRTSGG